MFSRNSDAKLTGVGCDVVLEIAEGKTNVVFMDVLVGSMISSLDTFLDHFVRIQ